MRICILFGSLRNNSNTALLLQPFISELERLGAEVDCLKIKDMHIESCTACWACQNVFEGPGCPKNDDMNIVYESVMKSDCIIFASPIYSWYCTPPMKAVMDRLVYGMNKYYGDTKGPCLWEGKKCALVTTCGYEIEAGSGVFEEGLRRYCKHSKLNYLGKLAVRDINGKSYFQCESTVNAARDFANKVYNSLL
ncbi:MAG: flavodoxin family protein [Clostridiaceae bacterium]|nr:flavodoxin family protein [Clostridiaceae bacterium]